MPSSRYQAETSRQYFNDGIGRNFWQLIWHHHVRKLHFGHFIVPILLQLHVHAMLQRLYGARC